MTKVYLICEDDGEYCVKGVYDDKLLAESKFKEYLSAWATRRFINCEIPEELLTEDGLINAYRWHHHFIEELDLNSGEMLEREIEWARNYLKIIEAKNENQNDI
jgi:hypothetical protein